MVGRVRSVALVGLRALPVTVEAHVGPGLPAFTVIGASGTAAVQAADRVRTALAAVGVRLPQQKVLVSLAPADVPKAGARFDLAMATAVLLELGVVGGLDDVALLGELALDGALRAVPGVLPSVAALPDLGVRRLFVPERNAPEAALAGLVDVVAVRDLGEAVGVLRGERPARRLEAGGPGVLPMAGGADLADVRGQPEARRALEVAAAGGHHLVLIGPPGCGKSMLARRLPSVLPPLPRDAALEVTAIRSVAGLLNDGEAPGLDRRPPLRAPHHSTSAAALLGGGSGLARPGEVSLAHRGVLFLDELLEWPRRLLESLREPLADGVVRLARGKGTVTYPARFLLVAAANPCPCGGGERCGCPDEQIWSYRARLSGPLADRLDLAPSVQPLTAHDLLADGDAEPSLIVAARVAAARDAARERWGAGVNVNAEAPPALLRRVSRPKALAALAAAVDAGLLTGRGYDRALRVARTCADLEQSELVEVRHVQEAMGHRLGLLPAAQQVGGRRVPLRAPGSAPLAPTPVSAPAPAAPLARTPASAPLAPAPATAPALPR